MFRVIVPIFSVAILLSALELFTRLYLAVFPLPQTAFDFRKERPAPYADATYFSKEFIYESFQQPGGWQYPKGTQLIIPNDYKGSHFNVANGKRFTAFQPESHQNTVYLFGGSTIYNSEVPDHLTVASKLQLLFNEYYGSTYAIQNYGTTTVTTAQQLERLRTCFLKPGDIVIFYDGVNDIYQGLFYANPEKTMIQRNRQAIKDMSFLQKSMLALSRKSKFAQLFLDPIDRSMPHHLSDKVRMNQILGSMKAQFISAIKDANDYSSKNQAIFFHFLQPHLFSNETLSEYEKQLSKNFFIIPRGIKEAFLIGYPELKTATTELSASIPSYDLSNILNEHTNSEEYFLDNCHVTHKANEIIARKIFDALRTYVDFQHKTKPMTHDARY